MATNERKRQQKLAKKKAKRKKALQEIKSIAARQIGRLSGVDQAQRASHAPVHECWMPEALFEGGMGTVVVSRKLADGDIAASVILLDVYCLGVKNAYFRLMPEVEYDYTLRDLRQRETMKSVSAACVRKLVDGAEAYARDLGFEPHSDYRLARRIFGDVDAGECTETFEFGNNGKPFFISGPYDTPMKIGKIVSTLTDRCGPGGFETMIMLGGPLDDDLDFDEDVDDDDEEYDDEYEDDDGDAESEEKSEEK